MVYQVPLCCYKLNIVFKDIFISKDINSLAWLPTKIMGMREDLEMVGNIINQNKGITRSIKN